jgi:hypothetical protein
MIFLGDIAYPPGFVSTSPVPRFEQPVVANLEGAIAAPGEASLQDRIVFNDPAVLPYLQSLNVAALSLANNHIMDVDQSLNHTIEALEAMGIRSFGAASSSRLARQPALIQADESATCALLGFGWEVIGCHAAGAKSPGTSPLRPAGVLEAVRTARSEFSNAEIVLFLHWNYELELYPQPMHRALAFRAIEEGASAVIGCHSHCVQGVEHYLGAPIVYGLGNWMMPNGFFFNGNLTFPALTELRLAFEWSKHELGTCHWFQYLPQTHELRWVESEPAQESERVSQLTPFAGMNHETYISWFKKHRRKKALLPTYGHLHHKRRNRARDLWVLGRQSLIDTSVSVGLKGGPK